MAEDKGFAPSAKKLKQARKDGKTAKSQILTQAFGFLACFVTARSLWHFLEIKTLNLLEYTLTSGYNNPVECLRLWLNIFFVVVACSLVVCLIICIIIESLQVGFIIEPAILSPKFSRLDIAAGFKKIFSGLSGVWSKLLRIAVICCVFFWFFKRHISSISIWLLSDNALLVERTYLQLVYLGFACLLVFGFFEYLHNRRKFYKELSMSKDELMREFKEDEGDPHVKSHRRSAHEELLSQEMVNKIRKSKVIVVEKN